MATEKTEVPGIKCRKCGNGEFITQLRKVAVDIGWKLTQIHAVAPCSFCTKCGNLSVNLNATIGDLANLVPDPDYVEAQLQAQKEQAAVVKKAAAAKAKRDKAAKAKRDKTAAEIGAKKKAGKKKRKKGRK